MSFVRESVVALVKSSVSEPGPNALPSLEGGMEGQKIGEWKLVEEIGRGGMGTVYRALRGDGEFSIEAAIKILSRGVSSQMLLDRLSGLWILCAASLVLPLVCATAEVPTIAKVIAVASTASAFCFSGFRARHAQDLDDLDF